MGCEGQHFSGSSSGAGRGFTFLTNLNLPLRATTAARTRACSAALPRKGATAKPAPCCEGKEQARSRQEGKENKTARNCCSGKDDKMCAKEGKECCGKKRWPATAKTERTAARRRNRIALTAPGVKLARTTKRLRRTTGVFLLGRGIGRGAYAFRPRTRTSFSSSLFNSNSRACSSRVLSLRASFRS